MPSRLLSVFLRNKRKRPKSSKSLSLRTSHTWDKNANLEVNCFDWDDVWQKKISTLDTTSTLFRSDTTDLCALHLSKNQTTWRMATSYKVERITTWCEMDQSVKVSIQYSCHPLALLYSFYNLTHITNNFGYPRWKDIIKMYHKELKCDDV
jgi:hypothetical protein